MTVQLTELAELRLRTFLRGSAQQTPDKSWGVRIAVQDGGCSGYEYDLNIVEEPLANDLSELQGSVQLYIDAESAKFLDGVVIDYIDGLTESGFKFSNPNATSTCGCGSSFRVGDTSPEGVPCSV
ncbi:MAG: iron-sulfur cluster assembly accessory protein [Cyanobacteria bacterium P01_H01_bin.121]